MRPLTQRASKDPGDEGSPDGVPSAAEGDAFAEALRTAIEASGLGLSRIQYRLQTRGVRVSQATLSYWQSGGRRPERPESIAALAHLEQVLGLAPEALRRLLGPPRPRGRWAGRAVPLPSLAALWPESPVESVVGGLDVRWDDALERISLHDRLTIGVDRREQSFWMRQALRAQRSGADRWVHIYHIDEPGLPLPEIHPLRGCRLGRLACDRASGLLAAELMFHRPLAQGETVIIEFEMHYPEPRPLATGWERKLRRPIRQYDLEVEFTSPALPVDIAHYIVDDADGAERAGRPLALDAAHRLHAIALDLGPCRYGVRWSW